jgi:acetyltransferase
VVLHDPKTPEDKLPRPAIRPYPTQYVTQWLMQKKTPVTIRPIRPEDEPLMVKFHETLSEESVYHRYFSAMHLSQRITHERLTRICFNDYDREIALVAEMKSTKEEHGGIILGVGRLSKVHGANEAEFALLISDHWQNHGLGFELLKRLVEIGRAEKLERVTGEIMADNHGMRHLCGKLGFQIVTDEENRTCTAVFKY